MTGAANDIFLVSSDGLNLRSQPGTQPGTARMSLDIGQRVTVIDDADLPGWKHVTLSIDGTSHEGFVSGDFLRPPESDMIEKLLEEAHTEWFRFKRGDGKENRTPYSGFIGEMWKALGHNDLDGNDTEAPWSAAFISFVVRNAGYDDFNFSAQHSQFIHDSIVKRDADKKSPFWGYRLNERRPALGDIVCKWRITKVDYDFARTHASFSSHTDVVVEVRADSIRVIGGNVSNSVSMGTLRLDDEGFLRSENDVFALLGNNHRS